MEEYKYIPISKIGFVVTGRTPLTSDQSNYGKDFMFIGPTDLHKHFIIHETEKMVSIKGLDSVKSSVLEGTTILVGCIGWDMGNVGVVDVKCVTNQQINSITKIKPSFNPFYIYYWLKGKKDYLFQQASVTRTPILNKSTFSNIEIPIPKKAHQDKVANVLISLDKKIDLNNRINSELEGMAKLIYDYWFVQFDFPISEAQAAAMGRPELKGKPYKSSGGKMVFNKELKREVPEGWEDAELQDIANITMGQSPPGDSYNEEAEGIVFYQGCTDFGSRFPTNRKFTTQPARYASKGDILLSVRAPVGTMNIANEDCCIGRGLAALNSKDDCISYLDGVLQYMKQIFDRRNADGTTFGSITKGDLFSLAVIKPSKEVLKNFDVMVKPMFNKQNIIGFENQKLSELRDWLLPMLMNGQVRVMGDVGEVRMAAEPGAEYGK